MSASMGRCERRVDRPTGEPGCPDRPDRPRPGGARRGRRGRRLLRDLDPRRGGRRPLVAAPRRRCYAVPAAGPDPVGDRLAAVAEGLDAGRRVAASLLTQSLASRPVSILLCAATAGVLPDLSPRTVLHARPWAGGPVPLWADPERLTGTELGRPGRPAHGGGARRGAGPGPPGAAGRGHPGPGVGVGAGAVGQRDVGARRGGAGARRRAPRPPRRRARDRAGASSSTSPSPGSGASSPTPATRAASGSPARTCCLYYRVPGGGKCADCVLRR